VIDGQQRLTTIIIFLSSLFPRLSQVKVMSETELEIFEDMIKRHSSYRFATVDFDNQLPTGHRLSDNGPTTIY
jgi:hypothetical protein